MAVADKFLAFETESQDLVDNSTIVGAESKVQYTEPTVVMYVACLVVVILAPSANLLAEPLVDELAHVAGKQSAEDLILEHTLAEFEPMVGYTKPPSVKYINYLRLAAVNNVSSVVEPVIVAGNYLGNVIQQQSTAEPTFYPNSAELSDHESLVNSKQVES